MKKKIAINKYYSIKFEKNLLVQELELNECKHLVESNSIPILIYQFCLAPIQALYFLTKPALNMPKIYKVNTIYFFISFKANKIYL